MKAKDIRVGHMLTVKSGQDIFRGPAAEVHQTSDGMVNVVGYRWWRNDVPMPANYRVELDLEAEDDATISELSEQADAMKEQGGSA